MAVLWSPVAIAVFRSPPSAVAEVPSPVATALELVPSADEVAVPLSTRVSPLTDTLTFALDVEPDDVDESESDGLADAAHGVAAIPIPTPSATANPPIRPI